MGENYQNKLCLVTGAARGIGKACAEKFAEYGADIIMVDINKDVLNASSNEIAHKYGCKAYPYVVDISNIDECVSFMNSVNENIGTVDVLANCAGITVSKCMIDLTLDEWERVINVNLRGIWYLSQLFAKQLKSAGKEKGNIVSISSQASKIGEYANGVYSVSKAGINSLTQVLGLEYAQYGISVSAVCPGYVNTEMVQEVFQKRSAVEGMSPEEYEKELTKDVALKRMCEPSEVADLMAYLAGGRADYITGVTVTIAGGKTLI
ncbi:SDR family NAD(P)-dependent oxidoreductase [Anaerostipes sp.]|uniref:SDR family NAD(P)-dependent oxidoreductase n=1 Tax=Anaerostipes sp. TaxID=1872530 RepID=UPI0025BF75BD|nr:SDR family oxidoreductase [Anaerostipes sp.]MBS7008758.1 SDR family oxidoreductase [Anaerostipes sp.]